MMMNRKPNRLDRRLGPAMALLLLSTSLAAGQPMRSCEEAGAGSWVANLRERMLSFDGLGRHAVERFGAPIDCRGEATTKFEGMEFGAMRLEFPSGAVLQVETFPPESSRVALTLPGGFADETEARGLLRAYLDEIGAQVDWSAPEITTEDGATVETYRGDTELNASAQLVFTGGKVTTLRFALAL
jgi:hypothetical protein